MLRYEREYKTKVDYILAGVRKQAIKEEKGCTQEPPIGSSKMEKVKQSQIQRRK
jgi:hypothetical protein